MSAKRYWDENSQIADIKIARYVDMVFERMAEYHTVDKRDKATGLAGDNMAKVKSSWAREFSLMTPDMVVRGGKKIRDQRFCPNLAGFTQSCKPSADEAMAEAQAGISERSGGKFGTWTCPAVYWAAMKFGASDLKTVNMNFANKRWETIYESMIEKQERGELDLIPDAVSVEVLIDYQPSTARAKEVEDRLAEIVAPKPSNHVAWAFTCKSLAAANMLVSGLNGVHSTTLAAAGKANIKNGKVLLDGKIWKIGKHWGAA